MRLRQTVFGVVACGLTACCFLACSGDDTIVPFDAADAGSRVDATIAPDSAVAPDAAIAQDGGDGAEGSTRTDASAIDAGTPTMPIDGSPGCTFLPEAGTLGLPSVASGTRLVPRTVAEPVDGGVEIPIATYDTKLGANCDPLPYVDGTIRCVPNGPAEINGYADAAKTMPIMLAPLASPPTPGTYAINPPAVHPIFPYNGPSLAFACGFIGASDVGRVGGLRASKQWYSLGGGLNTAPPDQGVYDVIPEVDFVEVDEVIVQRSPQIAVRELHGTDGSRLFATDLLDILHGVPVTIHSADSVGYADPPGGPRCMPPTTGTTGFHFLPPPGVAVGNLLPDQSWCNSPDSIFNDVTCARFPGSRALAPPRFVTVGTGASSATFAVAEESGTLFGCDVLNGQMDGPLILTSSVQTVLVPCAPTPLAEWVPATKVTLGAGRLTTSVFAIEGVPFATPHSGGQALPDLYDTILGTTCAANAADDGVLRCVPGAPGSIAYTDASCTMPVVVNNPSPNPNPVAPAFAQKGASFFTVGAAHAAAPLYRLVTTCGPMGTAVSFDLGALVPASTFVALELRDAAP